MAEIVRVTSVTRDFKVAGGNLQVAAGLRQSRGNLQRGAGIMGSDRVERTEQQVVVGNAKHGENVFN